MKAKTSITLNEDVLAAIDSLVGPDGSRSAFIERVLRAFIRRRQRNRANSSELAALNRYATHLNAEAADVLGYQTTLDE